MQKTIYRETHIGGEVISYWCIALTIVVIPDIIAIFWNRLHPSVGNGQERGELTLVKER